MSGGDALRDLHTGLPNRHAFVQRLEELVGAAGPGQPLGVLLVDIDDMRALDEHFGHDVADRVLVTFARRLEESVSAGEFVGRVGGDEFAVLVEDIALARRRSSASPTA